MVDLPQQLGPIKTVVFRSSKTKSVGFSATTAPNFLLTP
jgi:hypothetical protein